jgi:hypothetical protein
VIIYALIMCTAVGQPYESCNVYPRDRPVIYQTLGECKEFERAMKMAFLNNGAGITVECRGKHVETWMLVR